MPQVLIRNLKARTLQRLKKKARDHGRSLEAELRHLLDEAANLERDWSDYWARVAEFRNSLKGRIHSDSADLIREDRER